MQPKSALNPRQSAAKDIPDKPTTTNGTTYISPKAVEGMPALKAAFKAGISQKLPSGAYQQDYDQIEGYKVGLNKILNAKSDKADYDLAVERYNNSGAGKVETFEELREKLDTELWEYSEGLRHPKTGEYLPDISPQEIQLREMLRDMKPAEADDFLLNLERTNDPELANQFNALIDETPDYSIYETEHLAPEMGAEEPPRYSGR